VVRFTLRPLYTQGKGPWYPLDRPQKRSGHGGEEKNSQPPAGNRIPEPRSSNPQPVAIPTEAQEVGTIIVQVKVNLCLSLPWRRMSCLIKHRAVTMALRPTQPPIQWVTGVLFLAVKRPGREADQSPPSSADVKEYASMAWCSVKTHE
jgi:hypothetical protein